MPMTSTAKKALSTAIRGLRARLLEDLHNATESAWRMSVIARDAGLSEKEAAHRRRFEDWVDDQVRADVEAEVERQRKARWTDAKVQQTRDAVRVKLRSEGAADRHRRVVEARAATTLLHRLVVLRLLEAPRPHSDAIRPVAVLTGGWESRAYKDFRQLAPALVKDDPTQGYAFLLKLVFDELAIELPGLFGHAGVAELVPVPAATLRHVVDTLNAPALDSCWTDELTLGWVYQYWNDPAREALDAKLNSGGKVEPHEIASKTQMFTERYMVDWGLQNTLGPLWLAICEQHGWTPEVVADGTLDRLEQRRVDWRAQRDRGEVALTDLMPLNTDAERRWAYYLPQPLPTDAKDHAPSTLRDFKLLDPAVGSGHFLVVALDLLVPLYREEARHRGEEGQPRWTDATIVERILSHNLHGIDLDPRAVQIAAATLWLRARQICEEARPRRMNLVAARLRLGSLPDTDPALLELRRVVEQETGIPAALTDTVVSALRGADHLGTLLRVDAAVETALSRHEQVLSRVEPEQGTLFGGFAPQQTRIPIERATARATLLDKLEDFLGAHTGGEDLGLRLRGQQLAAGVRFLRMVQPGSYDVVVGNPPYQGTSKLDDASYIKAEYPRGKADLYAAFLERGLELCREGGASALLTMRNWMFIKQYKDLREWLLETFDLRGLGDFDKGAFEHMDTSQLISVAFPVFRATAPTGRPAVAIQPTAPGEKYWSRDRTCLKRAAVLVQRGRFQFEVERLRVVPEWPLVYWWGKAMLNLYGDFPLVGDVSPSRAAQSTGNNVWFTRLVWEVAANAWNAGRADSQGWRPLVMGASGREWIDPVSSLVLWGGHGLPVKISKCHKTGVETCGLANEEYYLQGIGVAFSAIGARFSVRMHRVPSVFESMGSSVFPREPAQAVIAMNSSTSRRILSDLNPTVHFQTGDINRLPLFEVSDWREIFCLLDTAFTLHESHREPSVEFLQPGPSAWRHAQDWAQLAVDRPEGAPLPEYTEVLDPEPPTDHISYALGVALGRFNPDGTGIVDPASDDLSHALPDGILLLDRTLSTPHTGDDLGHPAFAALQAAWSTHGPQVDTKRKTLRDYLALDFFSNVHRTMYENRPIHWPLSSSSKTFVAWVTIHRWTADTLTALQARLDTLRIRLEGELDDLRTVRDGTDTKAARAAERRFAKVQRWRQELADFIADVAQCADKGAPPTDPSPKKCPPRAQDAVYAPDLDDGVMINSAGVWPLLQPQWKDPRKWWTQLALDSPKGNKSLDWSHLAMRYWPARVDAKCRKDPSLGVAHGCFWRYHPARAWAWELRLQDEIGPDFRIEEGPYTHPDGSKSTDHIALRAAFIAERPDEALAAVEKEAVRRMGRGDKKKLVPELRLLESGIWTARPEQVWELEDKLTHKQQHPFRVQAPDAAQARSALLAAQPELDHARRQAESALSPNPDLFAALQADA